MICQNCNNKNREGSSFCRFCGNKLSNNVNKINGKIFNVLSYPLWAKIKAVKNKLSPKIIIISVLILLVSTTTVFAAPKIKGYLEVNNAIKKAKELQSSGNYANALASLAQITDKWSLKSQKDEIGELKEKQEQYIEYKKIFDSALRKEKGGAYEEAREMLKTIKSDFPEYNLVEEKTNEIQSKIEQKLKAEIEEKEAEKKEAEKKTQAEAEAKRRAQAQAQAEAEARRRAEEQTQEEAAARTRAEAEARASAEAKARADAQAAAAAQAAREAEYRRQQEEQERARQVRISFLNQLTNAHSSLNDGVTYYNRAMSYYNSGDELVALAGFGQARAIFNNVYDQASNIKSAFSNLASAYLNAANNLILASSEYLKAVNAIVNHIGSGAYGTSNANYYAGNGDVYNNAVRQFLVSEGY